MKNNYLLRIAFFALALMFLTQGWAQITSQEARIAMGRGINLGNTLEPELEGGWNNGPAKESYFDMYKEAGFTTVRIPIRWDKHTATTSPYTVDGDWMDRVEEIVNWGLARDLFIIINMHHEEPFKTDYANQQVRYDSIWSQISVRFKDKPEKLIFEMMNEPNGVTQENIDEFNPRVLSMIRKNNPTRIVIYSGKGWASSNDMITAAIPVDTYDPYLMAYYHSYDPWPFAGEGTGTWGTQAHVNEMVAQMEKVQNWSIEKNIPVLIGEFGAQKKCEYNSRMFYYATYVEQALAHDLAFAVWDDGGDFEVMLRGAAKWNDIKDVLIHTSDTSPTTLKAKVENNSSVKLTWNSRLQTKEKVYVEKRTLSTSFTAIAEFGQVSGTTTVTEYVDTDVVDKKTYYYRVVEEVNGKLIPSYPVNFTVKFVSVNDKAERNLTVFPNPASTHLNIDFNGEKMENLTIYNSNGALVRTENSGASTLSMNIEDLNAGIYFLIVNTSNGIQKTKFVKQ